MCMRMGEGTWRRYVATHASGQVLHALDLVGCGAAYGRIALQPVCVCVCSPSLRSHCTVSVYSSVAAP